MAEAQASNVRDRAIAFMEKIKGVTDPQITDEDEVAGGALLTVKLKREGADSWGWYFEKGDVRRALFTGEEIAKFISNQLSKKSAIHTLIDTLTARDSYSVSVRFLAVGLIVIYFAFLFSGNGSNIFIFLITMAIALLLVSISARVYFSDFKAPDVIPEQDRELLVNIIKENGKDGLDTYIRLSSLYGVTGNITKLGLSGLPLVTVALTVFFTGLGAVLWGLSTDHGAESIVSNMMDLAKLTLGAFIGSFVQRNVSANVSGTSPPP